MKDQPISFETAKLAKEKKFIIDVLNYYTKDGTFVSGIIYNFGLYANWNVNLETYSAPTQSLLQKWLREKYDIHVLPMLLSGSYDYNIYYPIHHCEVCTGDFDTYEEALEIGLFEGLKLIKDAI